MVKPLLEVWVLRDDSEVHCDWVLAFVDHEWGMSSWVGYVALCSGTVGERETVCVLGIWVVDTGFWGRRLAGNHWKETKVGDLNYCVCLVWFISARQTSEFTRQRSMPAMYLVPYRVPRRAERTTPSSPESQLHAVFTITWLPHSSNFQFPIPVSLTPPHVPGRSYAFFGLHLILYIGVVTNLFTCTGLIEFSTIRPLLRLVSVY